MAETTDDEREEELSTLAAIYPELTRDTEDPFSATLELPVTPSKPLLVRFLPSKSPLVRSLPSSTTEQATTYADVASTNGGPHVERDIQLSHLPPLSLHLTLPADYPTNSPPKATLQAKQDWLPKDKLEELEQQAARLWDEYGGGQVLFGYIDYLSQAAEDGFSLDQRPEGCLVLEAAQERDLVTFDRDTKLSTFRAGTFDCGICLEPKKGSSCHRMKHCGHVFCLQCLQDFYNNAISEGDIVNVRCLDPGCGKDPPRARDAPTPKKKKRERTLHPRELLEMGLQEDMVRRYVEMKRKKRLEADKSTVYCPRTWCQGAARSAKYPPIPADLASFVANEDSSDSEDESSTKKDPNASVTSDSRLAICEKCTLAFCRVCYMGWHGDFQRCYPRDPNELSAEEKASYDYIRMNTSPCATCNSPIVKTMGCNHMKCFQCNTHFCYLCGAWLDADNPYSHYNTAGSQCYQRLWELEEGDEGQRPADGRGFAGGRGWEQMAIDVARQADEEEAAAAALRAQEEEDGRAAEQLEETADRAPPEAVFAVANALAQVNLNGAPAAGNPAAAAVAPAAARRPRNPFPRHPPAPGAQARNVRNHERGGGRGRGGGGNARGGGNAGHAEREAERQRQEIQRFLELAERDEEDGWDSDELGDEAGFQIR